MAQEQLFIITEYRDFDVDLLSITTFLMPEVVSLLYRFNAILRRTLDSQHVEELCGGCGSRDIR